MLQKLTDDDNRHQILLKHIDLKNVKSLVARKDRRYLVDAVTRLDIISLQYLSELGQTHCVVSSLPTVLLQR